VGIPGAQAWKPWWAALFEPVSRVIILADGDEPGLEFAAKVKADIPQAVILPHNERQDTNSVLVNEGEEALVELINKYR
jgi:gene 57 protein